MGPELYNLYVEKLITEATELLKLKVLLSAQVSLYEKINAELNTKVEELEKALTKANSSKNSKKDNSDF